MIIVTGGAGFIGSNIVASLCSDLNKKVIVCDIFESDKKWKNLSNSLFEDIIFPEQLNEFLEKFSNQIEVIIHMGAVSSTTVTDSELAINTNYKFPKYLWEWSAKNKIPFFYASSAATYGNGDNGFNDDNDIHKFQNLSPLNLYGWSKHLFDLWVLKQINNSLPSPPRWAGLKFFNVYGQNEYHKGNMQSLIAKNFKNVMNGKPVNLFKSYDSKYADGEQLRDFIYVNDCVSVINWLLSGNRPSMIYNVGTGVARSFNDLIQCMGSSIGKTPAIEFIDMPADIQKNYQYFTQAKTENIQKAGYDRPFTSLEEGVDIYVKNYLITNNPYR
jgi:ADP-L-glycero-D-manno-heptose 6-epimerase